MSSTSSSVEEKDVHNAQLQQILEQDYSAKELNLNLDMTLQRRLLTPFMSKKVPPLPSEEERTAYPQYHSNFISKIFFWWLFPVMKVGYKRTLQPRDLWYLDEPLKVERYYLDFEKELNKRLEGPRLEHELVIEKKKLEGTYNSEEDDEFQYPKYVLVWSLLAAFKYEYTLSLVFNTLASIVFVLNPLLSKALINFVEKKSYGLEPNVGKGVGYALGVSFMILLGGLLINHFMHRAMMVGAQVKLVLTKLMLEKSLRLNAKGRQKYPASRITSIMGTDLARIDLALGFLPFGLCFPVPVIIAIALLIVNIGVASLTGIGIFLVLLFLIGYGTKNLFSLRKQLIVFTDLRVSYMKELLNNLKVIKFYSWEDSYSNTISTVRTKEMNILLRLLFSRAMFTSFAITLSQLSSMVAFLVMYKIASSKNPGEIFSSVSFFNMLAQQMMMVPLSLASGSDALIGILRVSELLQCGEINQLEQASYYEDVESLKASGVAVHLHDASFEWRTFELEEEEADQLKGEKLAKDLQIGSSGKGAESETEKGGRTGAGDLEVNNFKGLHDISLDIKEGEFVVVTGLIGSGKSSLLSALAGFMHKMKGDLKINGSLLLSGQPWIQNATVRENILFGRPFNLKVYKEVLEACSLELDLEILPAGDRTEIGERGITLSGGQKARISLARSVYLNKDIILMDDVLSAVDARVGKHIMDNCILGLLATKTRVLATHQLSLIGSANRIIFLNGDGSIETGTLEYLMENNEGFKSLMSFNADAASDDEDALDQDDSSIEEEERELIRRETLQHVVTGGVAEGHDEQNEQMVSGLLMTQEDRAVNQIGLLVYRQYVKLGSGVFGKGIGPLFLTFVILATFCQLFTNTWLSFWVDEKFDRSSSFYMGLYAMFTFLTMFFVCFEFLLLSYICNRALKELNIRSVQRLLRVPMAFMDTTPMGRILNRFTKDTDSLDNEIGEQLRLLVFSFANIVGVLILCIIYLPWFAIAVPFLVLMFVSIASLYQASGREVKRLELIQRSFVYNNFNEILNGVWTIKAYKQDDRFLAKNNFLINKMNEAYYITIANQRWLAIHLDMVATAFCMIIAFLSVFRVFNITGASTGLLLSYVIQIAGQLSLLLRAVTQVENEMNSVERLCHYAFKLEQELPFEISETKPAPEWPQDGSIDFNDVSLSYRPGLPLVLKNLSLHVGGGEKIGICGRTGAGKSSIMTALFRISELSGGSISIDGVDIGKIGLRDLRSKLSIIPQDPVLLRGNIRKNLDPFNQYSDQWLWKSLQKAGLIDDIAILMEQEGENMHKFHLNQSVEDDGANFSLGERQLIALARAVVRDSKILILDEATSSVDYETDSKIQATIVREFSHCTILCIAHRLKTIVDYDRVLVLDRGELKEFDTPWNLFNMPDGIFRSMCDRSNIVKDDFSRK